MIVSIIILFTTEYIKCVIFFKNIKKGITTNFNFFKTFIEEENIYKIKNDIKKIKTKK